MSASISLLGPPLAMQSKGLDRPSKWIDVVHLLFAGASQWSPRSATAVAAGNSTILPCDGLGPDRPLDNVGADLDTAVGEETLEACYVQFKELPPGGLLARRIFALHFEAGYTDGRTAWQNPSPFNSWPIVLSSRDPIFLGDPSRQISVSNAQRQGSPGRPRPHKTAEFPTLIVVEFRTLARSRHVNKSLGARTICTVTPPTLAACPREPPS